jgi:hypothetical protein
MLRLGLTALLPAVLVGCSGVPTSRLEECRNRSQALQAEAARLKDESLRLRSRNRELARRAVEDAERIQGLRDANDQLRRSVVAYQDERDELAASFDRLQVELRAAAEGPPRASLDRLEAFARAHPGCVLDAERGVWVFPAEALFVPGTATLAPGAELLLTAFARLLDDPGGRLVPLSVAPYRAAPEIRQASAGPDGGGPDDLAGRRAAELRDRLAERLGVDTGRIEVAGEPAEVEGSAPAGGLAIRLIPRLGEP